MNKQQLEELLGLPTKARDMRLDNERMRSLLEDVIIHLQDLDALYVDQMQRSNVETRGELGTRNKALLDRVVEYMNPGSDDDKIYPLYGQNNPPLGWHIGVPIESEAQLPYETVCGVKLDYMGRIYVSDTGKIKREGVCPDCLRIVEEPAS